MVDSKTAYLQRHCVPELIDDLINKLVDVEPPDPKAFLAAQLREGGPFANGGRQGELPEQLELGAHEGELVVNVRLSVGLPQVVVLKEKVSSLAEELRARPEVRSVELARDGQVEDVIYITVHVAGVHEYKEAGIGSAISNTAVQCGAAAEFSVWRKGL
eukprot:Hpha_TRINITY_DN22186_c0_g1::TRINITY_DN22186_c0_g1_i1::g.103530::m.103530